MSVTVTRVHCAHYDLPRAAWWNVPIEDHTVAIDAIHLVTCTVYSADGQTGLGYTYTLSHGGAAVYAVLAGEIAPALLGRDFDRPEPVWHELWHRMLRYGRGGVVSVALCAADVALWDLLSRAAALPLYRYIGAHRSDVPVYGSSIDLGYSHDRLLETVAEWKRRGFTAVKIKVGRPMAEDLERLTAVRQLLGHEIELMVDANNGWDLPEAGRRISAMAPFGLTWVEEPLLPDDISGHAQLQRQSGTPIAAGETLFSVADFAHYFRASAMRYVQSDVGRLGGITPWLAVAHLAAAEHLPIAPHFLHDLHVHVLCAVPNAHRLEYLPLLDAVIEQPLAVDAKGLAAPPPRTGHGVRLREAAVAPHLVGEVDRTV